MRLLSNIIILSCIFLITACGPSQKTQVYINEDIAEKIILPAAFDVKVTGNVFFKDGDEEIKVGEILKEAIVAKLQSKKIYIHDIDSIQNKYIIVAEITNYKPGNAAGRYFFGTIGMKNFSSSIGIDTNICKLTANNGENIIGESIAYIPTMDYVYQGIFGGIGGWKSVIKDAGSQIVNAINDTFIDK